jgi:hypothetical protein
MGVDGVHQLVDGAFEIHGDYGFCDDLRGRWADDVDAEDLAILGVGDDLDEAVVRVDDGGLGVAGEGELADFDFVALFLRLRFRSGRPTRSAARYRCSLGCAGG